MDPLFNCAGCGTAYPSFRWTDTHGIAVCGRCGCLYRLLHYEGEGDDKRRVERPPTCLIEGVYLDLGRDYFRATGEPMFPGEYCFGMRGRYYSGHTFEQAAAFREWMDAEPRWIAETARRDADGAAAESAGKVA